MIDDQLNDQLKKAAKPRYRTVGEIQAEGEEQAQIPPEPAGEPQSDPEVARVIEQNHKLDYDEERPEFTREVNMEPFIKAERFKDDEPIFPGGPLLSQVKSWYTMTQKQGMGHNVYITPYSKDLIVIWRTLSRSEYKEITSMKNTDPLQREEMICEQCVLWPQPFHYVVQAKGLAGIPSLIATHIMIASGFDRSVGFQPLF